MEGTHGARRLAISAASLYGVVAAGWIILSDAGLESVFDVRIEGAGDVVKGLAFVAVTSVVLYLVLRRYEGRLLDLGRRLERQLEIDAQLFRSSPVGMFVYDPDTLEILEVNDWLVEGTGRSRDELRTMLVSDLVPHQDKAHIQRVARSLGPTGDPQVWMHLDAEGGHRWLEVTSHRIHLDGRAARLAVARDVTAQLMAEEALRASERRLASVLSSMQEMAFSIDVGEGRITYLNDVASEVLGMPTSEMLMSIDEFLTFIVPEDRPQVRSALDDVIAMGWAEREIRVVGRDGVARTLRVRGSAVVGDDGRVRQIDGVAVDLTHRQELERLVQHQRSFDQLTGLAVRPAFLAAVDAALAAAPHASPPGVVAMFDLDRFADVNESAGHMAGDQVLVAVAQRIGAVMEPGMVAGRVGGDEFAVFCPPGMVSSSDIGSRLRSAVEGLFLAEGYEFFIGMSVGLAEAERGATAHDLLRDAHLAMSAAKARTSGIEVFEPTHRTQAVDRVRAEGELRRAISQGRLVPVYQPEIDLRTGRLVGVEALVRWDDPERGLVPAAEFVAEAERSNLIIELGDLMLSAALMQAADWHRRFGDAAPVTWVNLSRRELDDPAVVERVAVAIDAAGVPVHLVGIEVTETAFVADGGHGIDSLAALADLGVGLALDDFGTGWSSLQSLKSFPLTMVKIDRSFVSNVVDAIHDRKIVQAVIGMAHGMSLQTIAEGVETHQQLEVLRALGCDVAQGYLLGRPTAADGISSILESGGVPSAMRLRVVRGTGRAERS